MDWKHEFERYRGFAESSADWFWETDAELRFVWFSDSVKDAFGVLPQWHYGKTSEQMLGEESNPSAWHEHLRTLHAYLPFRDFIFQYKGDESAPDVWISTSGVPVFDENRRFQGYRGMARDVSQEVKARHAALTAEARLHEALRVCADALVLYDANDTLVLWNDAFETLFHEIKDVLRVGVSFEQTVRTALERGVIPDAIGHEETWLKERLAAHRTAAGPIERELADGRIFVVQERSIAEGGILAIWTDITALRQAQSAERQAEQRRRLLAASIDQLDELFLLVDEADRIVIANEKFREINAAVAHTVRPGVLFEEHIRAALAAGLYPEAAQREDEWLRERLARHRNPQGPFELECQDGRILLVHEQLLPSGGAVTISLDVTAHKRAEIATAQVNKMQAIGQLAAGIAHDFNNMLGTILGNVHLGMLANADGAGEDTRRYLEEIRLAGERARDIVAQLLAFGRGDSGVMETFSLRHVLDETVKLLRATLPASVKLKIDINDELEMYGQVVTLKQAILNLGINARDAMSGRGTLAIKFLRSRRGQHERCNSCQLPVNGDFAILSIEDTGSGIAAADLGRLFEPFYTTKNLFKI